ncbi:MAG: transposase [Desulfocapsa sp.]|nr:transposase [Desulfocapsa sp.]
MKGKRRAHSDKFKAKIAIEAIKGVKTLSELAAEYKIHPNQISTWKKQLQMNAAELFTHGKKSKAKTEEELTAPLYEEIGWRQALIIPSGDNVDWQAYQDLVFIISLPLRQRKIYC